MKTRRLTNPFSGLLTHLSLLASLGVLGVAVLANGDGGGDGGGGDGGGDAGSGKGEGDGKGGDGKGDGDGKPGTVTMTQAELDKLIDKAHGKAKSTAEADFKKWLDAQALSVSDRAKVEKEAAEKERDDARGEALQARIETSAERAALRAKVDPDRVERFMRLVDLQADDLKTADGKPDSDAIKRAVDKTLDEFPEFKTAGGGDGKGADGKGKGGSSGGDHSGGSTGKVFTRAEIAKMTPTEFAANEAEIDRQTKAGLIKV